MRRLLLAGAVAAAVIVILLVAVLTGGSAPVNTALPEISGEPTTGRPLSCSNGSWSGSPSSFAYEWRRGARPIRGATAATYTPRAADEGQDIACRVTATNRTGSTSVASGAVVPSAASTANLFVEPSAGVCARSSEPLEYAGSASPDHRCGDIATAWGASLPGDTIVVKGGSYDSESLLRDEDHGRRAAETLIVEAPGETVTLDGLLIDGANGVRVKGMKIGQADPSLGSPDIRAGNRIVLDAIDFTSSGQIIGGSNVTVRNSDIGPYDTDPDGDGTVTCPGSGFKIDGARNLSLIDNVTHGFEVLTCPPPNDHLDCWHIYEHLTGTLTIRGNVFYDCENYGILYGSNQSSAPERALIENNWFGDVDTGATCAFALAGGASESFEDVTVQFNSGTSCVTPQTASTLVDVVWRGNLVANVGGECRTGVTYSYNQQTDTSGAPTCGTGDATGVIAGFVNDASGAKMDLHLTDGSAMIDAAGATCPATDIDGEPRPKGSACDAGADEAG